jgi:hypothetical protein
MDTSTAAGELIFHVFGAVAHASASAQSIITVMVKRVRPRAHLAAKSCALADPLCGGDIPAERSLLGSKTCPGHRPDRREYAGNARAAVSNNR